MKPTKNKVFCVAVQRFKMLFENEKKAENFMKFNNEQIEIESGYSPKRSYFCTSCGGWHLTSMHQKIGLSKNEQILEQLIEQNQKMPTIKAEKKDKMFNDLESHIIELDIPQKELFFSEQIDILKKQIEQLLASPNSSNLETLKNLRLNLESIYLIRKKYGYQIEKKINQKVEDDRKQATEQWRLWFEKIHSIEKKQ